MIVDWAQWGRWGRRHAHRLVLVGLLCWMALVRFWQARVFLSPSQTVRRFAGIDSWYQYRSVRYTLNQWPDTLGFDPWTGYPVGATPGQFGTVYDQFLAGLVLALSGGTPTADFVHTIAVSTAPVLGVLTAIPTYYLARRLADGHRWSGVLGVGALAVLPGQFFLRTRAGVVDHHAAEALLMATTALLFLWAIDRAVAQDLRFTALTTQAGLWSSATGTTIAAGSSLAAYILVWPPGGVFIVFVGCYLGLHALLNTDAPQDQFEPPFTVGALSAVTAGLLIWGSGIRPAIDILTPSYLHLGLLLALLCWCGVLAGGRRWYPVPNWYRGGLLVGTASVGVVGGLVAPAISRLLWMNVVRTFGVWTIQDMQRAVGEARPLVGPETGVTLLVIEYGLLFSPALVGFLISSGRAVRSRAPGRLWVTVWLSLVGLMAFTQVRYNYYFAVGVAACAGYGLTIIATEGDLMPAIRQRAITPGTGLLLIALVMVFLPSALYLSTVAFADISTQNTDQTKAWNETLTWLRTETPAEGDLHNANNTAAIDQYGNYDRATFDYPTGTYGVVSWWDYGHWVTMVGERMPVANPFQQHVKPTARYLLAPSEQQAATVATTLAPNATLRYVVVDWSMATPARTGHAIAARHPTLTPTDLRTATGRRTQRYHTSLLARLYNHHGSAAAPSQAWGAPHKPVAALHHYRLVYASPTTIADVPTARAHHAPLAGVPALPTPTESTSPPSYVKVFERVPGARVQGTALPNATVTARVELAVPQTNTTFTYTQQTTTAANGTFTVVVPYATTHYARWRPETGYTNTSIRATGAYTITATTTDRQQQTTLHVPEAAVIKNHPISVCLLSANECNDRQQHA